MQDFTSQASDLLDDVVKDVSPSGAGTPGPPGPTGPSGGSPEEYILTNPTTTWIITHSLGHPPTSVRVLDTSDTEVLAEVRDSSSTQVTIVFSQLFSGKAYLS